MSDVVNEVYPNFMRSTTPSKKPSMSAVPFTPPTASWIYSKKGRTFHSQARDIINSVTKFCEMEACAKKLQIPLALAQKRAAALTGVSVTTIKRIKKEVIKYEDSNDPEDRPSSPTKQRKRLDHRTVLVEDLDMCVIRNIVNEFYVTKKQIPTLGNLLPVVQERIKFPWKKETLRRVLHSIGFQWKECTDGRLVLMEKPHVVAQRFHFLQRMLSYRNENRDIVYISETIIDNNTFIEKVPKEAKDGAGAQRVNEIRNTNAALKNLKGQLNILIGGSQIGFIPESVVIYEAESKVGDYQGDLSPELFEKWVKEKFLPNIPANCVVCLDNSPCHNRNQDCIPSKYSSKQALMEWLKAKNVPFAVTMRKPTLYNLILKNAPVTKKYAIDEFMKQRGHDVIRLPLFHWDLNPLEYIWASIKKTLKKTVLENFNASTCMSKLHELSSESLKCMSGEDYLKPFTHVQELENKCWEIDFLVESIIDNLLIRLKDTGDSSDGEEKSVRSAERENELMSD